jgi:hypothetical protein
MVYSGTKSQETNSQTRKTSSSTKSTKRKSTNFWDAMPCSLIEVCQSFGGIHNINLQGRSVCLANKRATKRIRTVGLLGLFFDPEDEAMCSSETSVNIYHTTWRHIIEDSIINIHRRQDPKTFHLSLGLSSCNLSNRYTKQKSNLPLGRICITIVIVIFIMIVILMLYFLLTSSRIKSVIVPLWIIFVSVYSPNKLGTFPL